MDNLMRAILNNREDKNKLKASDYICAVCGWDIEDCKGKHEENN